MAEAEFHIIIPARYNSTRLPGKLLLEIHGKSIIQRVYEQAKQCNAATVSIATDDQRIYAAAKAFGADVYMTNPAHSCGTERLAEMVDLLQLPSTAIVVNVQGDEPLIPPSMIEKAALELVAAPAAQVATLATPITTLDEMFDPNVVKVVLTAENYALLFSRAPIPWQRDGFKSTGKHPGWENFTLQPDAKFQLDAKFKPDAKFQPDAKFHHGGGCLRHVGLYAYRCSALQQFITWPAPAIETAECLEQLRFLWYGQKIKVAVVAENLPKGIDVQADLDEILTKLPF